MKNILLWLDDERNPFNQWQFGCESLWHEVFNDNFFHMKDYEVVWVHSYDEFVDWINTNCLPTAICFDHDLGWGKSGKDAANWLVEYCIDNNANIPMFASQSYNPTGAANILSLLKQASQKLNK